MATTIKFFYNGLKINGEKKLVKAHYSVIQNWVSGEREIKDQLVIYASEYSGFPAEIHEMFEVENNTDYNQDYFEKDRIRVHPGHDLFTAVLAAFEKQQARRIKRAEKWGNKAYAEQCQREIEAAREMAA